MLARAALIATLMTAGAVDLLWINVVLVPEWLGTTPLVAWPRTGVGQSSEAMSAVDLPDASAHASSDANMDEREHNATIPADEALVQHAGDQEADADESPSTGGPVQQPSLEDEVDPQVAVVPEAVAENQRGPVDEADGGRDEPQRGPDDEQRGDGGVERADGKPMGETDEAVAELPRVILFREIGSFALSKQSREQLKSLAAYLRDNERILVSLRGYSDRRGSMRVNLELSNKRARIVRAYLMQHGVAPSRIQAEGVGKSVPVIAEGGRESFVLERRVEIVLSEAK